MFRESDYRVIEGAGPVRPVITISNPLSFDITVQVTSIDVLAIGEYCSILIIHYYYNGMINMLQEDWIILLEHTLSQFLLETQLVHSIFQ